MQLFDVRIAYNARILNGFSNKFNKLLRDMITNEKNAHSKMHKFSVNMHFFIAANSVLVNIIPCAWLVRPNQYLSVCVLTNDQTEATVRASIMDHPAAELFV